MPGQPTASLLLPATATTTATATISASLMPPTGSDENASVEMGMDVLLDATNNNNTKPGHHGNDDPGQDQQDDSEYYDSESENADGLLSPTYFFRPNQSFHAATPTTPTTPTTAPAAEPGFWTTTTTTTTRANHYDLTQRPPVAPRPITLSPPRSVKRRRLVGVSTSPDASSLSVRTVSPTPSMSSGQQRQDLASNVAHWTAALNGTGVQALFPTLPPVMKHTPTVRVDSVLSLAVAPPLPPPMRRKWYGGRPSASSSSSPTMSSSTSTTAWDPVASVHAMVDASLSFTKSLPQCMGHGQPGALGALHPGAVFSGVQCSGTSRYGVSVAVQHVDADRGLAVAFLSISGLTDIHPVITTYLEAEIIGPHHAFTTGRWEADAEVDREHWSRFPEFEPLTDLLVSPTPAPAHVYDPVAAHDVVFMRWKELFLVPDHSQTSIEGASFSGFYYVALDLTAGTITGYYYSAASTWFQRLDLDYMPTDVGMPSYGFM